MRNKSRNYQKFMLASHLQFGILIIKKIESSENNSYALANFNWNETQRCKIYVLPSKWVENKYWRKVGHEFKNYQLLCHNTYESVESMGHHHHHLWSHHHSHYVMPRTFPDRNRAKTSEVWGSKSYCPIIYFFKKVKSN